MFLANRFVAGKFAEDAITVARRVNAQGMLAILDYLGEDVSTEAAAHAAADEYLKLIGLIAEANVRASISLKVSQMGILISRSVCLDNLRRVAGQAAKNKVFVWFDMEGSKLTGPTIDVFDALRQDYSDVGLCLQAALVRTGGDYDQLAKKPVHIRLCKGAYQEPATIAYQEKAAVNGNYRMLAQKMLGQTEKGTFPAFATHDRQMIAHVLTLVQDQKVPRDRFEFQMLFGIENKHLLSLIQQGYRGSVYIPYGTHWLPYFMRRLRERKENVYFLIRNLFRG